MKDIDGDRRERHGGGAPALPPAPELALLLREATERLARELAQPSAQAPDWSPIGWRVAMAAAVIHGIAGLLDERLRWRGPPVWQAFLTGQRQHLRQREERIRDTPRRIDAEALRDGLPVIGLKGSALLGLRAYAPGLRPMADIDLLVRPEDRLPALRMLARLGLPAGGRLRPPPDAAARVVRSGLGRPFRRARRSGDQDRIAQPRRRAAAGARRRHHGADPTPSAAPGLRPYPDLVALMRHLVLHTAGNMRTHTLRLVQLHDLGADGRTALGAGLAGAGRWRR